jgi:hypothetical protein
VALPGRPPAGGTPSQAASEAGSLSFNMAGASESVTVGAWHSKLPDRDMAITAACRGILSGDGPPPVQPPRLGRATGREPPFHCTEGAHWQAHDGAHCHCAHDRASEADSERRRRHVQLLSGGPASGPGPIREVT